MSKEQNKHAKPANRLQRLVIRPKWMDTCECPKCGEGIYNHRDEKGDIDEAQCSNRKCDWSYPNDIPKFNDRGAPFLCYCDGCGVPMYADEYTEQLDCLGLCDECYLHEPDHYDDYGWI